MNWQGLEVKHDQYGAGRILVVDDQYLTVRFESVGDKLFQFPQSLEHVLHIDELEARKEAHRLTEEREQETAAREAKKDLLRSRIEVDLSEELMRRYEKQQRAMKRKSRSSAGSRNRSNIVFKCDLYDPEGDVPEFNGITYDDYKAGQEIVSEDYEAQSDVFNSWTLHAGTFVSGQKKGQGIRMAKARPHSLAILTVLPDGAEEDERVISAVFLIDRSYEGDEETPAWVQNTEPQYRLKFTEDEAFDLKLWRYYSNQTNPERIRMGSGIFRYIDDVQSAHVLRAIADLLKGTDREEQAQDFYETYCHLNQLDLEHLSKDEGPLSAHFDEQHAHDEHDDDLLDGEIDTSDIDDLIDSIDEAFEDDEEDAMDEDIGDVDIDDFDDAEIDEEFEDGFGDEDLDEDDE